MGSLEQALRDFLSNRAKRARDAGDLEILNRFADDLNDEASDVLAYQDRALSIALGLS